MTKLPLSIAVIAIALMSVASAQTQTQTQSLKIPSITRPPFIPAQQHDAREDSRPRDVTEQLPPETRRCGDAAATDAATAEARQHHDQRLAGATADLQTGIVGGVVQMQSGVSAPPPQPAQAAPAEATPTTPPLRRCPH